MLRLLTPVDIAPCGDFLTSRDRVLVLGSCFADSIGQRLLESGFDVLVNPFGTLYNPASLLSALERIAGGVHFTEADCVQMGAGAGLVCSYSHHTSFARPEVSGFLDNANRALDEAAEFWRGCTRLIVTLGTAWCYRSVETGRIVSNCLKRPAADFSRERLTVGQTVSLLQQMQELAGERGMVLTVSPIRHLADGAHGNQLSKSTLLLAVDEFLQNAPATSRYFPSYEILMDELRDYRFYAEDMTHPSSQAAQYICDRFCEWAVPSSEHAAMESARKAYRRSQHRPILNTSNKEQ